MPEPTEPTEPTTEPAKQCPTCGKAMDPAVRAYECPECQVETTTTMVVLGIIP